MNLKNLTHLARLLKKRAYTATELMGKLKVSKPTVYAWLEDLGQALRSSGSCLEASLDLRWHTLTRSRQDRPGVTGPKAWLYRVVKEKPSRKPLTTK